MTITFDKTIPILRIFEMEKAQDFYCGFLGFIIAWEHRFSEDLPAYMELSRDGLTLHLSEHHGDGCPGSTVFVWMTGVEAFHQEIMSKGYRYNRPSLETTFYDARCVEVIDPFGNRIRFNERITPSSEESAT